MERTMELRGGVRLPRLGLGVYRSAPGETTRRAVAEALAAGYRHVDTARIYGNERDVGEAVRNGPVPRAEVFVTTKLWNADQGFDEALRAFDASLDTLGLPYVDLYLIHWPVPGLRLESWRALERIHQEGRARAIGVSNYMVTHLEELAARARIMPAVNQIEVSPFFQQREVRAWCQAHQVAVEAYSPLTKAVRLHDPVFSELARRSGRSAAQVMLRWGLQHAMAVLPKSTRPEHIRENAAIFDFVLDDRSMASLDALEEGLATGWDPRDQP